MRTAGTERRTASPATAAETQGAVGDGVSVKRGRVVRHVLDPQLIVIGVGGGVLSGLLGVGGGIVMVPLLVLWAGYSQRDAHAISLGAIIPISLAGVVTYGVAGEVRVWEAVALSIGAVAGARVGAGLLTRLDDYVLKLAFGVFLVFVAVLMGVRA
jgi:uncharacterized membrane protein YfcA